MSDDDRELTELLQRLDRPVPMSADAEADLLAGLRAHLELGPISPDLESTPTHGLEPIPIEAARATSDRSRLGLAVAALAAALIVVLALAVRDTDTEVDPATSPPSASSVSNVNEACERFDRLSLPGLGGADPTTTQLDEAADALDRLRRDLATLDAIDEAEDLQIRIVAGQHRQAALEHRVGEDATQTLDTARAEWRDARESIDALAACE